MSDQRFPTFRRILVLGGVRSGKSRHAAETAQSIAGDEPVLFVATAKPAAGDSSMSERIAHHRAERPVHWTTLEQPLDLHHAVSSNGPEPVMIVDCLTIWLSNLFARCGDPDAPGFYAAVEQAVLPALDSLCEAIRHSQRHIVLVANDVGSGVAPATRLGNVFADMQGTVNQRVAATCDEVYLMVAGIEQKIK